MQLPLLNILVNQDISSRWSPASVYRGRHLFVELISNR